MPPLTINESPPVRALPIAVEKLKGSEKVPLDVNVPVGAT